MSTATYSELRRVAESYAECHGAVALRRVIVRVAGVADIRSVPDLARKDVIRALHGR